MSNGNIYLIGMMGSGKSVTGEALASDLGWAFVDLDTEIEKKENRSIADIFARDGEAYFRGVETAVLKELSGRKKHVFATGGGIILREENVRQMRETGRIILLQASAKTLWRRLQYATNRPLLNKPDPYGTLVQILADRESLYEKACYFSVMTDGKLAEDVAREIREILRVRS
jgi:shikimate kinase